MPDPSSDYYYQPEIPDWLRTAIIDRWDAYCNTYTALAARYCGDPDVYYSGINVTAQAINAWNTEYGLLYETLPTNTFVGQGDAWPAMQWSLYPLDAPTPPDTEPDRAWKAMYAGLATWQMYHVLLSEGFVRAFQFGHYGRKHR